MPSLTVIGAIDPLLQVVLEPGETLYAERNAMVAMDDTLSLTGRARGGVLSALARKMLNDETFFQQKIQADKERGQALLSPTLPGDVVLLDCGEHQYMLSDGAYLASTEHVEMEVKTQSLGRALLGNSGGFFLMQTAGHGQVAVSGFGSIRPIELTGEHSVYVDNGHLVAWDASLRYDIALNTAKQGMFGKLLHSQTSGEGVVLKISGKGKIYVCSRNRGGMLDWIFANMPEQKLLKN